MKPKATILVRGFFKNKHGKTAHGLIRYGNRYDVVSVIDESCAGEDAGEVLGLGPLKIPIVKNLDTTADTLIIGLAPSGGRLPPKWRDDIKLALDSGMDVISGLHQFLSADPELSSLAKKHGAIIEDLRRPPRELFVAQGHRAETPVVLTAGTDACVGKRTAALELLREARAGGYDAGFIATGQTGILIGCDAGVVVDSLPGDFISGMVEKMVTDVEKLGKDIIFVEGQGALGHHAYGSSAHGILYGAQPHGVVLVHPEGRLRRSSFRSVSLPPLTHELALIKAHSDTKLLGIALNCMELSGKDECRKRLTEYKTKHGVPVDDVLKGGAKRIFENLENSLLK